jgi:hypothetical protein
MQKININFGIYVKILHDIGIWNFNIGISSQGLEFGI